MTNDEHDKVGTMRESPEKAQEAVEAFLVEFRVLAEKYGLHGVFCIPVVQGSADYLSSGTALYGCGPHVADALARNILQDFDEDLLKAFWQAYARELQSRAQPLADVMSKTPSRPSEEEKLLKMTVPGEKKPWTN